MGRRGMRPDFRIDGEIPDQLKSTDSDGYAHGGKQWINLQRTHNSGVNTHILWFKCVYEQKEKERETSGLIQRLEAIEESCCLLEYLTPKKQQKENEARDFNAIDLLLLYLGEIVLDGTRTSRQNCQPIIDRHVYNCGATTSEYS